MEVKKAIEKLYKLDKLSEKLEYYRSCFWPPIQVGFYSEPTGYNINGIQHQLFCLCDQCKVKSPFMDFETYRDIRNQETQRIADFFESKLDYETKVEYFFKISQDCGTTSFTLTFVPDKLEELDIKVLPYKNIYTIDISPKDNAEISILKSHLKQRLLIGKYSFFMAQFTFEKRVEDLEKLLNINRVKDNRDDLYYEELDKIRKSKINRDSKKQKDITLFKILAIADDIIKGNHIESYNDFSKLEMTILAEDNNKYKEHLTRLLEGNNIPFVNQKENSSIQSEDKYLNCIWFQIGLVFVNGKAQELYEKYKLEKGHFLKITLELGFKKTDRPYFSETLNNSTINSKNIYRSANKMKTIYKYCLENQISLNDSFMSIYNALQIK
ncbi:hypothetical protein LNP27_09515 [Flavobacterium galactosidilyticum]|uniref:hypothetical protein n=1 Tax=Flavobacterium galactosidilyticum TaxID=2893886 RepID=UPI001E35F568|nr:hypothetical protein [Flavobacterium sp. F-340]UFH45371.1 hypothetical protein LNP27_09515 [Flavobacterium sp. F-340]